MNNASEITTAAKQAAPEQQDVFVIFYKMNYTDKKNIAVKKQTKFFLNLSFFMIEYFYTYKEGFVCLIT